MSAWLAALQAASEKERQEPTYLGNIGSRASGLAERVLEVIQTLLGFENPRSKCVPVHSRMRLHVKVLNVTRGLVELPGINMQVSCLLSHCCLPLIIITVFESESFNICRIWDGMLNLVSSFKSQIVTTCPYLSV